MIFKKLHEERAARYLMLDSWKWIVVDISQFFWHSAFEVSGYMCVIYNLISLGGKGRIPAPTAPLPPPPDSPVFLGKDMGTRPASTSLSTQSWN